MVRVNGVGGFGIINEILFASDSQTALVKLEFWPLSQLDLPQSMVILASDCAPYRAHKSRANNVHQFPDDHHHAALLMDAAA